MFIAKLGAALVAGLLSVAAAQTPAFAASPVTEAFLANVRPNVDFLDRSSRIATDRAATSGIRKFARGTAAEASKVADALDVLTPADHSFAVAAATAPAADGMVTGRAAAIDPSPATPVGLGQAANARMPVGTQDLARLEALSGKSFDDLYWEKQLDALSQLRADYRAYIAGGDDTALVAIAKRELPKVERRLLLLTKI